jgi:hypothetical protein
MRVKRKININVESYNAVHGHNRNGELIDSLKQGSAKVVLHAVNSEPAGGFEVNIRIIYQESTISSLKLVLLAALLRHV